MPAPPADSSSGSGERQVKGLFGVGKAPPPAGASLAGAPSADPLASLFASDTIVKAPGIHDAPSEAELGRWRATMQSSLFEERVVDPAPSPPPPAPPAAARDLAPPEPPRAATPRQAPPRAAPPTPPARGAATFEDDEVEMAPPAGAVDEPIVQLPAAKSRSTKSTGKRRRAAAAAAQAPTEEPAAPVRRRRFERGPTKSTLVALGIAAVGAIAALVIVLGPSGSSEAVVAPPVASAPPAAAPAPAAPAAAPAAAAAAAPAQEAEPPAETAKTVAAAKAPAAPEQRAPVEAAQPAAAPAKTTAAAEAAEDEEEGAPEGLLRASRQALAADDPEGAERIAREALAKAPQDHHAMEALVLALMDQDRGKDALPFARRMVQKRSRRVPYRLLLGDLLLMVGDDAAARAEWQKALELSPGDKAIKRRLGL